MMTNSATTALSSVAEKSARDVGAVSAGGRGRDPGVLEFAALMRKIDRIDPSYRQ